jgi:LmbE family N-acetylglucosaminyl deacetylase
MEIQEATMADQSVAVIVAHPDDEVLGFGGAMAAHAGRGDRVRVLILATGLASRAPGSAIETSELSALRQNAFDAAEILGVESIEFADFPDNQMDSVPLLDVVLRIEQFLADAVPSVVYTHHAGDLNIDHSVVARATLTACRPLPESNIVEILAGEVNSSTEWCAPLDQMVATEFIDIGDILERKLKALECYKNELRDWPHPRSLKAVEALARWRGAQVGLDAAEAFTLIRRIRCL